MGRLEILVILILGGISLEAQVLNAQKLTCDSNDFKALASFLDHLDSRIDEWKLGKNSSVYSNCCDWVGITCMSSLSLGLSDEFESGRVVKLDLSNRRLRGNLSESVGSLDQLKTLNLSHNFFRDSIPVSLLLLSNLEILDLSKNGFSGVFSVSVNLPKINVFDVSENGFRGLVPAGICNNSPLVRRINLAVNYFNGSIPLELGNCSSLEHLSLASNTLSGTILEDLFRLQNLSLLNLQENRLSGQLSNNIGNLSNLVRLDVSYNQLSGSIPDVFHTLNKLENLLARSNNFTGKIPYSLTNSHSVVSLSLRNNSLNGRIEINCSAMLKLVSLDLGSNQFHGSIPDNLPSCPKLTTINLSKINFRSQVPESFKNFTSLSYLSLSNSSIHNISAALRILQNCRNLKILVLTLNFHKEKLPSVPSLHFKSLNALVIANCKLTGTIPQWLIRSTQLQLLDLSWNQLEGTIPSWFGSFQFLFYLDLSNNSLSGELPQNLTSLESLSFRNISLEEPSPDFPFFMKRNLSARVLQYNKIWSFPPKLDLSNNFLQGHIWPEFGNLKKLHVLDLKYNNLSGGIPVTLSGMTSLETLDLSYNSLSGEIPSSLVRLCFLSNFNVANNNLSGRIPTEGQFPTFPNSSFEGNQWLCGEHVSPCQIAVNVPSRSGMKSKRRNGTIIAMAVGVGFGTIFLVYFIYLIVLRKTISEDIDAEVTENRDRSKEVESRLLVLFQIQDNNKEISLNDILKSTNSFDQSNIIGCGGFGLVYKGTFPNGKKIAIKRLSGDTGQMDREFQAEVETLSRARHPNLVQLEGYCNYHNDRLLIYTYMENSSLDYWLHEKVDGPSLLEWDARLQIAQGAAKGLAYLHQSCEPHILHRDIKSSNILLDEKFVAHLADFGLARLVLNYDSHVSTDLVGTLGYIPPEYGQASVATYKGDVYSFGVVLLELLTGRRPMDMCKPRGRRDLISWVFQMKRDRRESEVFDPLIYDKEHADELLVVLEIACLCLSENPKSRPSTQQLVSWLDNFDVNV
ncbi:phytosulfokine receptor 1-like [Apium graveolens]|uniref:phytosulfokine receptor 1-like n=1 Tax=Apium graveolens TaxID=4045 RepID=UPI003D78EBED